MWRVGFVPKRNRLVSCGADAAVRLWDLDLLTVPIEGLLDEAKARFGLQPGDGHVVEAP